MGKTATAESKTTDKGGTTVLAKTHPILQLVSTHLSGIPRMCLGSEAGFHASVSDTCRPGCGGGCKVGPQVPVLWEGEGLEGYCYLDVWASFLALRWYK